MDPEKMIKAFQRRLLFDLKQELSKHFRLMSRLYSYYIKESGCIERTVKKIHHLAEGNTDDTHAALKRCNEIIHKLEDKCHAKGYVFVCVMDAECF